MISGEVISRLKELVKEFDGEYLVACKISGSACFPFIDSPHDIDIVAYTSEGCPEHPLCYLRKLKSRMKTELGESISLIARKYEFLLRDDTLKTADGSFVRKTYVSNVIPEYNIMIKGTRDLICPNGRFDIIGKDRAEFLASSSAFVDSEIVRRVIERHGRTKSLYQTLCCIYFIENGKYELNEEQRKNVNIMHDCADGWEELFEYVKAWVIAHETA